MASAFAHALSATAIRTVTPKIVNGYRLLALGIICSILPDIDSIGYVLGIPYSSPWGHRGMTHSLSFALLLAVLLTWLFYRKHQLTRAAYGLITFYLFVATASHGLLDAMTNGGLGIAFFAPFDNSRYFLPYRPIAVSPIGIKSFFSEWGQRVILSELIWIGIPCTFVLLFGWVGKRLLVRAD
jgi:inner membrane protein